MKDHESISMKYQGMSGNVWFWDDLRGSARILENFKHLQTTSIITKPHHAVRQCSPNIQHPYRMLSGSPEKQKSPWAKARLVSWKVLQGWLPVNKIQQAVQEGEVGIVVSKKIAPPGKEKTKLNKIEAHQFSLKSKFHIFPNDPKWLHPPERI